MFFLFNVHLSITNFFDLPRTVKNECNALHITEFYWTLQVNSKGDANVILLILHKSKIFYKIKPPLM